METPLLNYSIIERFYSIKIVLCYVGFKTSIPIIRYDKVCFLRTYRVGRENLYTHIVYRLEITFEQKYLTRNVCKWKKKKKCQIFSRNPGIPDPVFPDGLYTGCLMAEVDF